MLPSILERNADFAKMTRMQQRVAIAKDVIDQLDAKEIVARNGVYLGLWDTKYGNYLSYRSEKEAKDSLCNSDVECAVCAIGAAAVVVTNGKAFDINNYGGDDALVNSLSDYFEYDEMRQIEGMFEGEAAYLAARRVGFPSRKEASDWRMRKVWQHVIDNGGAIDVRKFNTEMANV